MVLVVGVEICVCGSIVIEPGCCSCSYAMMTCPYSDWSCEVGSADICDECVGAGWLWCYHMTSFGCSVGADVFDVHCSSV